jgi:hypothetical protein
VPSNYCIVRQLYRYTYVWSFGAVSRAQSTLVPVEKAAARGRSVLALRRAPSRAPCLARPLCSGASPIGQTRQPATRGERIRPTWPRRALRALGQTGVKKQLRVGMARWLGSGHCPEGSAWLGHYARVLLTPARCADVPPLARASGQPGRGERARRPQIAPLAGSDDAEARRAASRRCGGFAQSCGRRRSFDTGRSDPCARHQQGSCGRRFVRRVRFSAEKTKSSFFDSPTRQLSAIGIALAAQCSCII